MVLLLLTAGHSELGCRVNVEGLDLPGRVSCLTPRQWVRFGSNWPGPTRVGTVASPALVSQLGCLHDLHVL